jgi:hypothetical protein
MLLEILSFLCIDFFAHIFGKMASNKIEYGGQIDLSLQKSIKYLLKKSQFLQCCRLLLRLRKLKYIFFSILKQTNFSKTQKNQNSLEKIL